ncbi:hypothetical protein ONZ45_g2790 [Pleurotus djamor]|nr:hypothetical protein ONZ45_g2790 [Pleurotus djamor]
MSKPNSTANAKSLYKTHPCRHFDDKGRPLEAGCNQGKKCRYLHPEDADWNSAVRKMALRAQRERADRKTGDSDAYIRDQRRTDDRPFKDSRSNRRSDPLPPQADLFLRFKGDREEEVVKRHGDSYVPDRDDVRQASDERYRRHRGGSRQDNRDKGREKNSRNLEETITLPKIEEADTTLKPVPVQNENAESTEPVLVPEATIQVEVIAKTADEIDRFREISRLAGCAMQDAAMRVDAERKLSAYTGLSTSVANVSSSASRMMAPALAEMFLQHAEAKKRAEESATALGNAWEEVMKEHQRETQRVVNEALKQALEKMEAKGQELEGLRRRVSPAEPIKRGSDMHGERGRGGDAADYDRRGTNTKRRRIGGYEPGHGGRREGDDPGDVLEQLKRQLDEQERRMQALKHENEQTDNQSSSDSPCPPPTTPGELDAAGDSSAGISVPLLAPLPTRRSPSILEVHNQGDSEELVDAVDGGSDNEVAELLGGEVSENQGVGPVGRLPIPDDEPSSVLASRIIRAHDNPSPPPDALSISASLGRGIVMLEDGMDDEDSAEVPPFALSTSREPTPTPELSDRAMDPFPPLDANTFLRRPTESEPCTHPPAALQPSPERSAATPPPQTPSPALSDHSDHEPDANAPHADIPMESSDGPASENTALPIPSIFPNHTPQLSNLVTPPKSSNNTADGSPSRILRRSPRRSVAVSYYPPFSAAGTSSQPPPPAPIRSPAPKTSRPPTSVLQSDEAEGDSDPKGKRKASPESQGDFSNAIRQLGSLSPDSNRLLSQLSFDTNLPSLSSALDAASKPPERNGTRLEDSLVPAPLFPHLFDGPQRIPMTPKRVGSPKRGTSPSKFQINPPLAEASQSPARRIPIEQAVQQGYLSPQKAAIFNSANAATPAGTSRMPTLNIPSSDSPARRIAAGSSNKAPPSKSSQRTAPSSKKPTHTKDIKASTSSQLPPSTGIQSTLPFPMVPAKPLPSSAVAGSSTAPPSSNPISPSKSSLKQPSSKIPRPVTKPYARPIARNVSKQQPVDIPTSPLKKSVTPAVSGSTKATKSVVREKPIRSALPSTSSPLKRKRQDSKPTALRPVVMIDKKPPFVGKTSTTEPKSKPKSPPKQRAQSPSLVPSVDAPIDETSPMRVSPDVEERDVKGRSTDSSPQVVDTLTNNDHPNTTPSLKPPDAYLETLALTLQQEDSSGVRRTTRSRKPVQYFPPPEPLAYPETRPLQSRRKAGTATSTEEGFAGMSATALKNLTSNNTARNQVYSTVTLETEVIRKDGSRPDSPVVKVKTVSEREQEDRGQMRRARAERRAKRHMLVDGEGSADVTPQSPPSSPSPGARESLDSVDVEVNLNDNVVNDLPMNGRRGVKWRPSLTRFVILDDIKPGSRARANENAIKKGCLAPKAKAIQLDTLGNLPNANSPLRDLVQENITVKKFVYDDDIEPEEEVVVVKNTRSRKKKS